MRLSHVLLVTSVVALFAPSTVVAEISAVALPEQVTAARSEGNSRRFLRSQDTIAATDDGDDDDGDDDDEENEERLSDAKINKLLEYTDDIFSHWKDKGYSVQTVRGKLDKWKHGLSTSQLSAIVNRYRSHIGE